MRQLSDIVYNQRPLILPPSCTVKDAARHMRERGIGAVLICDDGSLVGIFTGRDAVGRVLAEGKNAAATKLADVMTRNPKTMSHKLTAIDALRMMWDGGFRHIPLVEGGEIVGIVSRGDFKASEEGFFEEERHLWEHMR